jgi:MYXO-CTERM domain-containing protein
VAGLLQTNNPETMSFSFAGGVQGVSAYMFATDTSLNSAPSIMEVTLSDGSAYIGYSTSINDFIGFYSNGAAITGLSITATAVPGGPSAVYPTVDTMYFANVPAPGAIALLGLAGLIGRRRRN